MMHELKLFFAALLLAGSAHAADRETGDFDYYVLALSWSPAWCAFEGDPTETQCREARGFVLHGLWPQYERGWPQNCRTVERDPSRRETAAMADVFGSAGLAWYQWKKHGRCTGLSSQAYFAAAREAFGRIARPEVLRRIEEPMAIPPRIIEEAFLEENPDAVRDGVTVTCDRGHLDEVRVCLTKDLDPRPCAADARTDCRARTTIVLPAR